VTFPESTAVFAGEALQCKITFKNVSQRPGPKGPPSSLLGSPTSNGYTVGSSLGARKPQAPPLQISTGRSERINPRTPSSRPPSAGVKPSFPHAVPSAKSPALPSSPVATTDGRPSHKHKRTVSIVSISSDVGIESGRGSRDAGLRSPPAQPRSRGHGRAGSLQITPGKHAVVPNGSTPTSGTVLAMPLVSRFELRYVPSRSFAWEEHTADSDSRIRSHEQVHFPASKTKRSDYTDFARRDPSSWKVEVR
jgi:hypothetical protein